MTEVEGNRAVKASVRTISVWDTTSDEVMGIIMDALTRAAGASAPHAQG